MRPKQVKLFMADDPAPGTLDSQFSLQVRIFNIILLCFFVYSTSKCALCNVAGLTIFTTSAY
jgi:hypothetical protein